MKEMGILAEKFEEANEPFVRFFNCVDNFLSSYFIWSLERVFIFFQNTPRYVLETTTFFFCCSSIVLLNLKITAEMNFFFLVSYYLRDEIKMSLVGLEINLERALMIVKGRASLFLLDWIFNNPLYLLVIGTLGPITGGLVMFLLATWACALLLIKYIKNEKDWLGVEEMRQAFFYSEKSGLGKKIFIFFLLLWHEDSFRAVAFFVREKGLLEKKHWALFFVGAFLDNFYWTLRSYAILFLARKIF